MTGTVVRVSNYGVFVDIGAGVDAFLHRRKMKVGIITGRKTKWKWGEKREEKLKRNTTIDFLNIQQ